jgi:hypothetical protein
MGNTAEINRLVKLGVLKKVKGSGRRCAACVCELQDAGGKRRRVVFDDTCG